MSENPVVYNDYWTTDCVERLKRECQLANEIETNLLKLKHLANPNIVDELEKMIKEIQLLARGLNETQMIMERYQYNMESSIKKIADLIEKANQSSAKRFK